MCERASARRGLKPALTWEVLVRNLKPGFFYPRCTRSQAAHTGHFEKASITSVSAIRIHLRSASMLLRSFLPFYAGVYAAESDCVITFIGNKIVPFSAIAGV